MNVDNIPIKKEGHDGLIWALDTDNNMVFASEAKSGETYKCPCCGVAVHRCNPAAGAPYFAHNPGQPHKSEDCMAAEEKPKYFKKTPKKAIGVFCQPDDENHPYRPNGGPGPLHGFGPTVVPPANYEVSEITSLSQVFTQKLCFFPPE